MFSSLSMVDAFTRDLFEPARARTVFIRRHQRSKRYQVIQRAKNLEKVLGEFLDYETARLFSVRYAKNHAR